jgi:hypothetical protein
VPTPPAIVPGLPEPPVSLIAGQVVQVTAQGDAQLDIGCGSAEAAGCTGFVFLDPVPGRKGKGKGKAARQKAMRQALAFAARRGRYGSSPFVVAAGSRTRVAVRLTPEARRALGLPTGGKARAARRGRRVKAVVTVQPKGGSKQKAVVELRG